MSNFTQFLAEAKNHGYSYPGVNISVLQETTLLLSATFPEDVDLGFKNQHKNSVLYAKITNKAASGAQNTWIMKIWHDNGSNESKASNHSAADFWVAERAMPYNKGGAWSGSIKNGELVDENPKKNAYSNWKDAVDAFVAFVKKNGGTLRA